MSEQMVKYSDFMKLMNSLGYRNYNWKNRIPVYMADIKPKRAEDWDESLIKLKYYKY